MNTTQKNITTHNAQDTNIQADCCKSQMRGQRLTEFDLFDQCQLTAMKEISSALHVKQDELQNITVLKKGMTNRSFLITCRDKQYIVRIPGEGTVKLINRIQEAKVYEEIRGKGISDNVVAFNYENGCKITEYIPNAHNCDPQDPYQVQSCMKRLRQFHEQKLCVEHRFDLFEEMDYYESLRNGSPSMYTDYSATKEQVLSLRSYIQAQPRNWVLTHIDAVPDNFLICEDGSVRIIDWEYAGMQDPHVDIAMFAIYALYDRLHVERLIDAYFLEGCSQKIRTKIYCYIAVCGLLWSNWCEYKRLLGVEFGEYAICQYQYAKDYYHIAVEAMKHVYD